MDVQEIRAIADAIRGEVRKAVVGQDAVIDLMLTSLLVGGHILLEGVPGTAKTLITRAFAAGLALQFGRIQFTPDLMPGDVLGTNLFNFQTNSFVLTKGPIFTQLLLADEINRTPPKTQAALLQAMNERVITIDGKDYPLGDDFMVVATQNPIEQQGTYPLPEAQLDRFLFKMIIDHPSRDEELEIVRRHGHRSAMPRLEDFDLKAVANSAMLAAAREAVTHIRLSDPLVDYIVDVIRATRVHSSLEVGASTRAANMLAVRSARLCGAARPRLRHSRRRQNSRITGVAPSADDLAERRDRRHSRPIGFSAKFSTRRRHRDDPTDVTRGSCVCRRNSAGAAHRQRQFQPLGAVVRLWPACAAGRRERSRRWPAAGARSKSKVATPSRLYIGERGATALSITAGRFRRASSLPGDRRAARRT